MTRAQIAVAAAAWLGAATAAADSFLDTYTIDLDPGQIMPSTVPSGDRIEFNGLAISDEDDFGMLMGDDFTGDINFMPGEPLEVTGFQQVEFELRAGGAAAYTIDFDVIGETDGGDVVLASDSASSDFLTGVAGGAFVGPGTFNGVLTGLRFEFVLSTGNTFFQDFDLALNARILEVVPEPASLALLAAGALLALRRR